MKILRIVVVALLAPVTVLAHEVLHQVERGRAVAVRAYESDGESLAHAAYEVYSPADPGTPHQSGRTDRSGWLAFVPDVPGQWRVKVIDDTGHGLDVVVDAAPAASAAGATATAPASGAAFVLRPVAGVAVIAALFGILLAIYRRKRSTP